jgi:hypothetical protein
MNLNVIKQPPVTLRKAKPRRTLKRGGSRLKVAKARRGEDAIAVLQAAGILTADGNLSPKFA